MEDFTLLSKEQVWGRKRLDIFKKRGTKAVITDFSNVLRGSVNRETVDGSDYTENLGKRTGMYWTRTRVDESTYRSVYVIGKNGSKRSVYIKSREISIRPAISIFREKEIPTNGKPPKRAEDGVLEVEYGYYPQMSQSMPR